MKLHTLDIYNFRAIERTKTPFTFTNSLSQPRSISLIVGPNGSGKTSIFDAIQLVVRSMENPREPRLREGLEFTYADIVRGRGKHARIIFEFSIEDEEAQAINHVYNVLNLENPFKPSYKQPPISTSASMTWEFPRIQPATMVGDEREPLEFSFQYKLRSTAKILGARGRVARAVNQHLLPRSFFSKIGGVCYLDQRRSFRIAKTLSLEDNPEKFASDDVLSWLNLYYRRHQTWNADKYGESYWSKIKRLFEQVCSPAELVGIESGPDLDTLILKKHGMEYTLSQMSSGEHQILRILVGMVAETAENSIVLIDEVELHLHPAWQRRLIQALREDSLGNQYIFSTHSPVVRELFFEEEIIDLGDLGA